jgi:hypothetical protein
MAHRGPASTGSPGYCRKKAEELLKKAESAPTAEARLHYLVLADHWHRLAQSAEHPNW